MSSLALSRAVSYRGAARRASESSAAARTRRALENRGGAVAQRQVQRCCAPCRWQKDRRREQEDAAVEPVEHTRPDTQKRGTPVPAGGCPLRRPVKRVREQRLRQEQSRDNKGPKVKKKKSTCLVFSRRMRHSSASISPQCARAALFP